jgi:uncharacterized protein
MECRTQCGACCIALSISSAIPNMPDGKPAGERCINLRDDLTCNIYDMRPKACREFTPSLEFCGRSQSEAMQNIAEIERLTAKTI